MRGEMTEFRARVGRIRMKNGGADVRVLERTIDSGDGEDWRGTVVRNARALGEFATEDAPLVGYILIGFYGNGESSVGFRYDDKLCHIPRSLMPAWVAELIRRDMVTVPEAREVFDSKFECVDGTG